MLELATGTGLALSAGLNAWVPLIFLGVLSRFTDLVELPGTWAWLENGWVLAILSVLLVLEFAADKIPVLDSINDVVQTVVRPTAGGIAFGAGSMSETTTVTDPSTFVQSGQWIPIVAGIVLALGTHAAKAGGRVVANTVSGGTAAPVVSAAEDVTSIGLGFVSVLAPLLIIPVMILFVIGVVLLIRSLRRHRRARAAGHGGDDAYYV
ncbi:DUF4126 domain-containing protein [Promicromonospora thailandica]|uniref:DUF4126 domain-containing protein n=1 Tax=Promicromonospora thailandica TaxID=765201 RepID=A0A9X2JU94_9MICO|nr:DUF4126 domain-containing protein [Promicromonospora thailandica]MCP2263776.1 protein of unknown function (DUF4126) [Promicromonospora thailandica]BFF17938.1 DUF4126 domain-containing protein [Promicromonospora thailandica]